MATASSPFSAMSGALELAAGAFAIVGVADVAVRTGREVHSFLRNIVDAPEEINRLCTIVKEVAILAETAKQLLDKIAKQKQTDTTRQSISLFEVALKSLNRELQNLRVLSARFRGGNSAWSRVRYVLDERKLNKAFENLERSKSLIGNALQVAGRYVFFLVITTGTTAVGRLICRNGAPPQRQVLTVLVDRDRTINTKK